MIHRTYHLSQLKKHLSRFPVVAILGARQVGKTTLARQLANEWGGVVHHFDLEDADDQARLVDASFVLRSLTGLVVLDEIQLRPDLFPLLRVLADRQETPARFLILGSAAPELLKASSESLAGRVIYYEVAGLGLNELMVDGTDSPSWIDRRWLMGGFPCALLADDLENSFDWREAFIRTYLERDLPQLGINLPALTVRRFWTMVAHYHGQIWNSSELARSLAVSDKTVTRYLDILEGTFMALRLRPWFENLGKREIKAPKVYVNDSGILHRLLGIRNTDGLMAHPKCGASWEGFVINEILRHVNAKRDEAFFWGTYAGAELDLLIVKNGVKTGFEVKLTHSPRVTHTMRVVKDTLKLTHLYVLCRGGAGEGKNRSKVEPWVLSDNITAVPVECLGWEDQSPFETKLV